MVKFREIPKKVLDAAVVFTKEQLHQREGRLANPTLQASLERTKNLLADDFKNAAARGLESVYRFTLGAPISSLWEGTKEFGHVLAHNFSVKEAKQKKSYLNVPSTMITELLQQYGKGLLMLLNLLGI